ncbi:TPA: Lrp/AsnC family transcriptional regulator, partial [Candidatus Micrarchaeota archaeon]|nr:Lrp/AsnC family transcriptional regulator [Candidatus Micrarchaeota archaeon]
SLRRLAQRLGIPQTTLHSRVKRLVSEGVIEKFTVKVNPAKLGFEVTALIHVMVKEGRMLEAARIIARSPNAVAVYDITGEYDLLIIARFRRIDELDRFVKWVNGLDPVSRTVTSIVLRVVKEEPNSILNA